SPTSSKKIVPPLACSNRPILRSCAPVKAPFSCPNNSLSSNVGESAALWTVTNFALLRRLKLWIACAASSFPVPLSSSIKTFAAEAQIGQDKIDMFALENVHGAGNVTRHVNVVIVLEQAAQSVPRMFFVINDQDDGLNGIHE